MRDFTQMHFANSGAMLGSASTGAASDAVASSKTLDDDTVLMDAHSVMSWHGVDRCLGLRVDG